MLLWKPDDSSWCPVIKLHWWLIIMWLNTSVQSIMRIYVTYGTVISLGYCKKVWPSNSTGNSLFLGSATKIKETLFSKLSKKNDLIFSIKLSYFQSRSVKENFIMALRLCSHTYIIFQIFPKVIFCIIQWHMHFNLCQFTMILIAKWHY